jgi:hypothetical protein
VDVADRIETGTLWNASPPFDDSLNRAFGIIHRARSRNRDRPWVWRDREGSPGFRLHTAVASAVSHGACDVAAVRYLLTEAGLHKARPVAVDVGALAHYDRPLPNLAD